MTQPAALPHPGQLPTLTEVIELVPPTPVGEAGMTTAPRPMAPAAGTPGSAPIVTGGLASSQASADWTPMTTVVVPSLHPAPMSPVAVPPVDLPVLDAVVPEFDMSAVAPRLADGVKEGAELTSPALQPAQPVRVEMPAPVQAMPLAPVAPVVPAASAEPSAASAIAAPPVHSPAPQPDISETQVAQRVLSVVQKQIDGMIDFRLKEAIAPILARHSEAIVRDLREELSRTMADVVARAVAQEMARLRQR